MTSMSPMTEPTIWSCDSDQRLSSLNGGHTTDLDDYKERNAWFYQYMGVRMLELRYYLLTRQEMRYFY